jgi:hypothetical protein
MTELLSDYVLDLARTGIAQWTRVWSFGPAVGSKLRMTDFRRVALAMLARECDGHGPPLQAELILLRITEL